MRLTDEQCAAMLERSIAINEDCACHYFPPGRPDLRRLCQYHDGFSAALEIAQHHVNACDTSDQTVE